jgi:2-polyprenyl-3-methyl-5-hydroxy-6-metoxy-1,4-benzoquinol methylase
MLHLSEGIECREDDGIFIDAGWSSMGVTEQFLENASIYHERFNNNEHWKHLVELGLTATNVDRDQRINVLDIGSGSGNSVFAAVTLLPQANVVASDISPQLLRILLQTSQKVGANNLSAYCFDLHKDFFAENSFDLVIGGSILHHMLAPQDVLRNVTKWTKVGAPIILYEPMEASAHFMAMLYHVLIDELIDDADPRLIAHFRAMIRDYDARFGLPDVKPWTAHLDDKWFFSRSYFLGLGKDLGFKVEAILPTLDQFSGMFAQAVMTTLRLSGNGHLPLPEKLPGLLNEFDRGTAESIKKRVSLGTMVVLRKAPVDSALGSAA